MRPRWTIWAFTASAGIAFLIGGCQRIPIDMSGRPCDNGQCLDGYQCNLDTNICEAADGDSGCTLGLTQSCSACDDDCRTRVENVVTPICEAAGPSFVCGFSGGCLPGFVNGNGNRSDGCEQACVATVPATETCDGLDNDCNGLTDTADPALDSPEEVAADCGSQLCDNCNVATWVCAAGCSIGACAAGWVDRNGQADDGCEHKCTRTNPPAEVCDGVDNDCNGLTDTADPALDTPAELNAACGLARCTSCNVAQWACLGDCRVLLCATGYYDTNRNPADGCESTCAPETDVELCDRLGKDCDSFSASDNCGVDRTVDCGQCTTPETCGGGGRTNVCGSWWDCDWPSRRQATIAAGNAAVASPYSVAVTFDHAALVGAGLSRTDGNDVRVLWRSGAAWTELDRVLDPDSAWNQATTTIWFATQASIAANASDGEYFVYSGNMSAAAPPADEGAVFHFADLFRRANSGSVGNGWTIVDASAGDPATGNIDINANTLFFETTSNANDNQPLAEHTFPAISTGGLAWRLGSNWVMSGLESTFRVHMLLGLSTALENLPDSNLRTAGAGPSLAICGQSGSCTSTLGLHTEVNGTATLVTTSWSGARRIDVWIPDIGAHTYNLDVGGARLQTNASFSAASATSLDTVRLFTWAASTASFSSRAFRYVIVRRLVSPEPTASLAPALASDCP